jgi:uncharacterized membrane protein YfcA
MKDGISSFQEISAFMFGAALSFSLNAAVQKQKLPAVFDILNWPVLAALVLISLLQVYWRLKKVNAPSFYTLLWIGLIGCAFGAWAVSRFIK